MRPDGRGADQMRSLKITPDFISTAEGSVLIELGKTRVICTASVNDGVPGFLKGAGKGWVTGEYGMLPRATEERTAREAARGKQSGRTQEIQRLIGRSLRAITDQEALGERLFDCLRVQRGTGSQCGRPAVYRRRNAGSTGVGSSRNPKTCRNTAHYSAGEVFGARPVIQIYSIR